MKFVTNQPSSVKPVVVTIGESHQHAGAVDIMLDGVTVLRMVDGRIHRIPVEPWHERELAALGVNFYLHHVFMVAMN